MDQCTQQQSCFFDGWWRDKKKRDEGSDDEDSSSEDERYDRKERKKEEWKKGRSKEETGSSVKSASWDTTEKYLNELDVEQWYTNTLESHMPAEEREVQKGIDTELVRFVKDTVLNKAYFSKQVPLILQRISPKPNLVQLGKKGSAKRQLTDIQLDENVVLEEDERECLTNFYPSLINLLRLVFTRIGALESVQSQVPRAFRETSKIFSHLMNVRMLILNKAKQLPKLKKVDTSDEALRQLIMPRDGRLLIQMDALHASMQDLRTQIEQTDIKKAQLQNERDKLQAALQIHGSELEQIQRVRQEMLDIPMQIKAQETEYQLRQEGDDGDAEVRAQTRLPLASSSSKR